MINFDLKSVEESLAIVDKELKTYTRAITIIVDKLWFFNSWFQELKDFLTFVELPETTEKDCPLISDEFYTRTLDLINILPGLTICYPDADWSNIINALVSLINHYIGYQDTIIKAQYDEDQTIKLSNIKELLQHLAHYIEFGASIEVLFPLVMQLIDRIVHLDSNQPVTFELSKMYLDSLGYSGKDEWII